LFNFNNHAGGSPKLVPALDNLAVILLSPA